MSTLMNQARNRVPRFAEAAVERARLTVVPRPGSQRSGRAARVPFMTLVSLILVGGVAGLLFFNTSMQQVSFTASAMEQKAQLLDSQRQSLQMQLDGLRDPQQLAVAAKQMGMVPPASPAFIQLGDGKVLGTPTPATVDDAIRVNPMPIKKPKNLRPPPIIEKVSRPATTRGAAAAATRPTAGTKKSHDSQQGGPR
ncbi:MAG: hypothetical protein ABI776_11940 [Nocardioidaceae bacterium]